jgi:hypothetical protein
MTYPVLVRYCHYAMTLVNGRFVFEYGIEVLESEAADPLPCINQEINSDERSIIK